jgi:CRISPR-associated endonuclease/helicase Cas3
MKNSATEDAMTFPEMFRQATSFDPLPYQCRLAEDPDWPEALSVPTGMGKTAGIVLAWVWRRRWAESAVQQATPRRLVYCLPMRALVEQTAHLVSLWLDRLGLLAERPGDDRPVDGAAARSDPSGTRIAVSILMGGDIDGDWDVWPERDAVLIGTQDQLLSRALNRGYAMSRYRWPMHFALLHNDACWVFDEVQLMDAGLLTSVQLEAFRRTLNAARPASSLWASATLEAEWLTTVDFTPEPPGFRLLKLSAADAETAVAQRRLGAAKPLAWAATRLRGDDDADYALKLSAEILARHRPGTLTLAVVNTVARAQRLYTALRPNVSADCDRLLLHGRFRLADRARLNAHLTAPLPPGGRIVVATQVVEAGLDISARTLFTELAPWASLVQRFGRCNRYGEAPVVGGETAQVMVVDMDAQAPPEAYAPYKMEDVAAARDILLTLGDVGTAALPTRYAAWDDQHVLRRRDLLDLFDTSPDLAGADIDVARYIRSNADTDVQVFWHEMPSEGPSVAVPQPRPGELVSVSMAQFRRYLRHKVSGTARTAYRWDFVDGRWIAVNPADVYPGLTLLVDAAAGGYDPELGFLPDSTQPVAPVTVDSPPVAADDDGSDPTSVTRRFVTLSRHLLDTEQEASQLCRRLPGNYSPDAVARAARVHDLGKAHPVFVETMTGCLDPDDSRRGVLWAKSPCRQRHRRPHFRHELASALRLIDAGEADLVAYLAAAHHGKVRTSIRSLPGEKEPEQGRFARGIWDGDPLPHVDIDGESFPPHVLALDLVELGWGQRGPSWLERVVHLLDEWGPFRLAWMETLVRIADWRASRREQEDDESPAQ